MKKVDIIVPCFNEEEVIDLFFEETSKGYYCNNKLNVFSLDCRADVTAIICELV